MVNGLLHALAVRELAVASLLNSEAEKVAHVARTMTRPETFDDVISFQRTIAELMHALVRKEEVLLRRLNAVLALCATEAEVYSGSDSSAATVEDESACTNTAASDESEEPPGESDAADEPPLT